MHEHHSLYTHSLGRFWRPWIRKSRVLVIFLYCSGIRWDRTLREELDLLPIWFRYSYPSYLPVISWFSIYQIQLLFPFLHFLDFMYIKFSFYSSFFIWYHAWMLICDIAVIVDLLWFRFITCSGYFRLSVYTWGIFLAYIRRRLLSRLCFHVFWKSGAWQNYYHLFTSSLPFLTKQTHRDLQKEVHMEQPPGYVALWETKVGRLKKAIYGFKQNPRAWFEKFSITISSIDFHQRHLNHSVFVRRTKSCIVVLAVYVDDILLIGSDSAGLLKTKKYLKCHFVNKDMGHPKYFMRIEIAHQKHSVFFSDESMLWIFWRKQDFEMQAC